MENEPKRIPKFRVEFANGEKHICTPEDTTAYLHNLLPKADHLWVQEDTDPDSENKGVPLFRQQISNFNEILEYMKANGYSIIEPESGIPSDSDLAMYHRFLARLPIEPEPEHEPLTPRKERLISFLGYLLASEQLAPSDFDGDGELFI